MKSYSFNGFNNYYIVKTFNAFPCPSFLSPVFAVVICKQDPLISFFCYDVPIVLKKGVSLLKAILPLVIKLRVFASLETGFDFRRIFSRRSRVKNKTISENFVTNSGLKFCKPPSRRESFLFASCCKVSRFGLFRSVKTG